MIGENNKTCNKSGQFNFIVFYSAQCYLLYVIFCFQSRCLLIQKHKAVIYAHHPDDLSNKEITASAFYAILFVPD